MPSLLRSPTAVQFGQRDVVQVLRFGAAALVPASPAGIVEIFVEAPRTGIARKADAGGVVALLAQDLGQRLDFRAQPPLCRSATTCVEKQSMPVSMEAYALVVGMWAL